MNPPLDPDDLGAMPLIYRLLAAELRGDRASIEAMAGRSPEVAEIIAELVALRAGDESAAAHYRLWTYNVHPYASYFLSEDALLGGLAASEALTLYRALDGTDIERDGADHLAAALLQLSLGDPAGGAPLHALLHWVLRWLPSLDAVVQRQRDPYGTMLMSTIRELVTYHAALLDAHPAPWALPPASSPLAGRAGLREIVRHLGTPALAGFAISRDEIARIGRTLSLPTGFGSRYDMLQGLLRAAATYDRLPRVLGALRAIIAHDRARHSMLDGPAALSVAPWLERLDETESLLDEIERGAASLDDERAGEGQ